MVLKLKTYPRSYALTLLTSVLPLRFSSNARKTTSNVVRAPPNNSNARRTRVFIIRRGNRNQKIPSNGDNFFHSKNFYDVSSDEGASRPDCCDRFGRDKPCRAARLKCCAQKRIVDLIVNVSSTLGTIIYYYYRNEYSSVKITKCDRARPAPAYTNRFRI